MASRVAVVLTLSTITMAVACTDHNPVATPLEPSGVLSSAMAADESETLDEISRLVALALADHGLRQRIKNDMQASPFAEHKLEFRNYLRGRSGGILLAKMAKEAGMSRADVLRVLEEVRPLEFYMSIDAHREEWEGGPTLQVASWLPEAGDVANGYKPDGEVVLIDVNSVPETPTFVLVQQETNFDRPLDLTRVRNTNDRGGRTIGSYTMEPDCDDSTALDECGGSGGGGGGGGSTTTRYRTDQGYGQLERMFEYRLGRHLESNALFQGDPELHVVVTSHAPSPTNTSIPYFQSTVRFGIGGNDDTNWYFDNSDLVRWNQEYGNYMNLKFYEADSNNLIPITVTFEGKTYGIKITDENDDLGIWTYSFFDQSLTQGYDGHGVGKWGLNTGSANITVISDYVSP